MIRKTGKKTINALFALKDLKKLMEYLNIIGYFFSSSLDSLFISRNCGKAVCGECSLSKINDNRVCDVCFYKAHNGRAEERRIDQLKSKRLSLKTYNKQFNKEKEDFNQLTQMKYELEKKVKRKSSIISFS